MFYSLKKFLRRMKF